MSDVHNLEALEDLSRQILNVLAVLVREENLLYACTECADELLLDAADGHDLAAESDFAGHGECRRDSLAAEE
jgi:hypothetical protein